MGRVLPGSRPTQRVTQDDDFNFNPTEGGSSSTEATPTSTSAAIRNAQLARDKYNAEQAAAASALERQRLGAQEQYAYLTRQLGAGIPTALTQAIENQQTTGEQYIGDQAAALLGELQKREAASRGATTTGYSNLMNYLARNQPTAFAQAPRAQATPMTSDLLQYLAGQGVSGAPVQSQVDLANLAAQGGASNYNQLLNVLAAREQAAQQSRQSEAEMGLSSSLANLQAIYGQGTSQLEQQRLAALADLSSRVAANRFAAQQQQIARDQAIQDALAGLIGTGTLPQGAGTTTPLGGGEVATGGAGGGIGFGPAPTTPVQQLAAKIVGIQKPTLRQNVANFVAANPDATAEQIKAKFPSLGANIA
jgi:hypothetical protein